MKLRKSRFGIHDSEVTLHLRGAGGGLVRNVMKEEALEHFKTKTFTSKEQVPEDIKKFIESISSVNSLQVLKANANGYHQKLQKKLFGVLESTYKGLGYIIDRALLSDCKFVLLSRYFIRGAELMLPLKTCIRAAVSLKNELPCLHSKVNEISAF